LGPAPAVVSSANATWIDHAEAVAIRTAGDSIVWAPYGYVPELFSATPLVGIAAMVLRKRLPVALGGENAGVGVRLANGLESPVTLTALATDFTGCASGTTIELVL